MMICSMFDRENAKDRKRRAKQAAISTAEKLNGRIHHFLSDIDKNDSLTKTEKADIRQKLLKNL